MKRKTRGARKRKQEQNMNDVFITSVDPQHSDSSDVLFESFYLDQKGFEELFKENILKNTEHIVLYVGFKQLLNRSLQL